MPQAPELADPLVSASDVIKSDSAAPDDLAASKEGQESPSTLQKSPTEMIRESGQDEGAGSPSGEKDTQHAPSQLAAAPSDLFYNSEEKELEDQARKRRQVIHVN